MSSRKRGKKGRKKNISVNLPDQSGHCSTKIWQREKREHMHSHAQRKVNKTQVKNTRVLSGGGEGSEGGSAKQNKHSKGLKLGIMDWKLKYETRREQINKPMRVKPGGKSLVFVMLEPINPSSTFQSPQSKSIKAVFTLASSGSAQRNSGSECSSFGPV